MLLDQQRTLTPSTRVEKDAVLQQRMQLGPIELFRVADLADRTQDVVGSHRDCLSQLPVKRQPRVLHVGQRNALFVTTLVAEHHHLPSRLPVDS